MIFHETPIRHNYTALSISYSNHKSNIGEILDRFFFSFQYWFLSFQHSGNCFISSLAKAEKYLKHISHNILIIKGDTFFSQKIIKTGIVGNLRANSHECLYLSKLHMSFYFYAKFQFSGAICSAFFDYFREKSKFTTVPYQDIVNQTKRGIEVINIFSIIWNVRQYRNSAKLFLWQTFDRF